MGMMSGVGERGGPSDEGGGGGGEEIGNFWRYTVEGVRNFSSVIKKMYQLLWKGGGGWPPNLPLLLSFQIIFFTTKRHSVNNYSSISDYFLSN